MCPLCLIDYQYLYRARIRERNESEKASTGYPRDEYRGHVTLPPYFESRPSTPQSLGYGSNISEPMIFSHDSTTRRIIADTINSPTEKVSTPSSDHTRRVVIEQISTRDLQQPSTSRSKENRPNIYDESAHQRRASQPNTKPDVFERLRPTLTPNLNAKRLKANTPHNIERSHGREGMGEIERSGYQGKHSGR